MSSSKPTLSIAAIFAASIAGNPTQFACERGLAAVGLEDWQFLSFEVAEEDLATAIEGARVLGFQGLLIEEPLQRRAAELCLSRSEAANLAHYVDALFRIEDQPFAGSFLKCEVLSTAIAKVAEAKVAEDAEARCTISLVGEDAAMFAAVRPLLHETRYRWRSTSAPPEPLPEEVDWTQTSHLELAVDGQTDVLVQASRDCDAQVGERISEMTAPGLVVDLAEITGQSPLSERARALGLVGWTAMDVNVRQTALAFERWTGRPVDLGVIREAYEEFLEI